MEAKIRPMDYDRSQEESLGPQRNERLAKNAQRQLEYEKKARKSSLKDPENEKNPDTPTTEGSGGSMRIDAIVVVTLAMQFLGIITAGVEIYVYGMDQDWNDVLAGKTEFYESVDKQKTVFKGKTLKLEGHLYLEKTVEYARRDQFQELVFIIFILGFVVVTLIQMFFCYVRAADVDNNAIMLIAIYSIGGGFCIYSATFLVSAAVNIENSYTYAADMLHNFQYLSNDPPLGSTEQDRCQKEFKNGCDYYEYAKVQASILEQIFRICGSGSRFTRYSNKKTGDSSSVDISGETYTREDLKQLGFCSRDGYKFTAAVLAVFMGILCSLIPILFCCLGKSRSGQEDFAEPGRKRRSMRKSRGETPVQENQRQPSVSQEDDKVDQSAVLDQWKEYVERNSSEEGK